MITYDDSNRPIEMKMVFIQIFIFMNFLDWIKQPSEVFELSNLRLE